MSTSTQATGPSFFSGELNQKHSPGLVLAPIWNAGATGSSFTWYDTLLQPIYWFIWKAKQTTHTRKGGKEKRDQIKVLSTWFTPQVATIAKSGSGQSQEPETPSRPPMCSAVIHSLPRCIGRKPEQKQSSWDLSQHSNMGFWGHSGSLGCGTTMPAPKSNLRNFYPKSDFM